MKFRLLFCVFLLLLIIFACNKNGNSGEGLEVENEKEEEVDPNDNLPLLKSLKLMTYNIHSCIPPSKPNETDVDAVAKVIKETNPDIVFLQEVDKNTGRNGNYDDQVAKIAQKTGLEAQFFSAREQGKGFYGVAILSKYKIETVKTHLLPRNENLEQRVLGTAIIKLTGQERIMAGVTHLQHNSAENRLDQVKEVIKILKDEEVPIVLGGDFNELTSATDFFDLFDNVFIRTCIGYNCPNTFPANNPNSIIDFLSFRPSASFEVDSHFTINEKYASDHLPVVSVLKFKR